MQDKLDAINLMAGVVLDADEEAVDENSYEVFDQHANVPNILRWMRRHPDEVPKLNERREEIALQIQHKLIDLAATTQRNYEEMEKQVASGILNGTDLDEDPNAPLVTFLSHGKTEGGSFCRLLKQMLRRIIRLHSKSGDKSAARIFLDSDDMYSQSDLLQSVRRSKSMTLLLTKSVFFRPWIICEYVTAWRSGVPIIPLEVVSSGFDITPGTARSVITQHVDSHIINLVSQYCANCTLETVIDAVTGILSLPRVTLDPYAASSAQWAATFDLARALNQKAKLGDEFKL